MRSMRWARVGWGATAARGRKDSWPRGGVGRPPADHIARPTLPSPEPLLQFYKERVVELMMAKSPVFSLLEPHDRRALLEGSVLVDFEDQNLIVEEGALNDQLF